MFRVNILPIFRSTRLYVTACGIMHPRYCRPVAGNIVFILSKLVSDIIWLVFEQTDLLGQSLTKFVQLPLLSQCISYPKPTRTAHLCGACSQRALKCFPWDKTIKTRRWPHTPLGPEFMIVWSDIVITPFHFMLLQM